MPWARPIAALVAALALGCVPAADDDDDTGDTTGTSMTTTATTTMTTTADTTGDSTGDVPEVDYMSEIQPIWDANCVDGAAGTACHQPGGTWPTNDLTPANSYDNLLNADPLESLLPFVEPSDHTQSYLWYKVAGNMAWMGPPANGSCCDMPLVDGTMDPGPLSQEDIQKIQDWINGGAMP